MSSCFINVRSAALRVPFSSGSPAFQFGSLVSIVSRYFCRSTASAMPHLPSVLRSPRTDSDSIRDLIAAVVDQDGLQLTARCFLCISRKDGLCRRSGDEKQNTQDDRSTFPYFHDIVSPFAVALITVFQDSGRRTGNFRIFCDFYKNRLPFFTNRIIRRRLA